jgi:hypothetical protein
VRKLKKQNKTKQNIASYGRSPIWLFFFKIKIKALGARHLDRRRRRGVLSSPCES